MKPGDAVIWMEDGPRRGKVVRVTAKTIQVAEYWGNDNDDFATWLPHGPHYRINLGLYPYQQELWEKLQALTTQDWQQHTAIHREITHLLAEANKSTEEATA